MLDFFGNKILIVVGGCVLLLPAAPFLALALVGLITIIWLISCVVGGADDDDDDDDE